MQMISNSQYKFSGKASLAYMCKNQVFNKGLFILVF